MKQQIREEVNMKALIIFNDTNILLLKSEQDYVLLFFKRKRSMQVSIRRKITLFMYYVVRIPAFLVILCEALQSNGKDLLKPGQSSSLQLRC